MAETRVGRLKQLAKGTEAAAAALPAERQELAGRATQVADAWSDALTELDPEDRAVTGMESVLQPAVSTLESLHFQLLEVGVLGREPDEKAFESTLSEANRLAEEVARRFEASSGSD